MRLFSTIVISSLLVGCEGTPARIGMMDADELTDVATVHLCDIYSFLHRHDAKIWLELERRNIFTAREWEAVEQYRIFIGMSEAAFRCSWPKPEFGDIDSAFVSKDGPWGG